MKKTIAIDLDDTLSNNMGQWIHVYNLEANQFMTLEDIHEWDLSKSVIESWKDKTGELFKRPGWFYRNTVVSNAQEVITRLAEEYIIYIASAYYCTTVVDKVNWLQKNFPCIDSRNIIFCNPKHLIHADFLIDDGPHNLVSFTGTPIVFDRPWNRDCATTNDGRTIHRINGWLEIETLLERL